MTRSKLSAKVLASVGVKSIGQEQGKAAAPAASKYRLQFVKDALKEWNALDGSVKEPLRKLLRKRLDEPRMPGAELAGDLQGCYKIKLRRQGYRLVYQVSDEVLLVLVLAVDKREDNLVYASAAERRGIPLMVSEPPLLPPAGKGSAAGGRLREKSAQSKARGKKPVR